MAVRDETRKWSVYRPSPRWMTSEGLGHLECLWIFWVWVPALKRNFIYRTHIPYIYSLTVWCTYFVLFSDRILLYIPGWLHTHVYYHICHLSYLTVFVVNWHFVCDSWNKVRHQILHFCYHLNKFQCCEHCGFLHLGCSVYIFKVLIRESGRIQLLFSTLI